jgi:hypothetical protein
MLLMLKKFLLTAYGLLPQRVALYAAGNAERRKTVRAFLHVICAEEKIECVLGL